MATVSCRRRALTSRSVTPPAKINLATDLQGPPQRHESHEAHQRRARCPNCVSGVPKVQSNVPKLHLEHGLVVLTWFAGRWSPQGPPADQPDQVFSRQRFHAPHNCPPHSCRHCFGVCRVHVADRPEPAQPRRHRHRRTALTETRSAHLGVTGRCAAHAPYRTRPPYGGGPAPLGRRRLQFLAHPA